jgi:hypothetical protein
VIPALMLLLALTGLGTGKSSVVGGNVANCIFLVGSGDSGINEGARVVSIDGAKSPLDHFGEEGSGVVVFLSVRLFTSHRRKVVGRCDVLGADDLVGDAELVGGYSTWEAEGREVCER